MKLILHYIRSFGLSADVWANLDVGSDLISIKHLLSLIEP